MRGRALENALSLAAKHYEREGRAYVFHRATRMFTRRDGKMAYGSKAGCDFNGSIAGGIGIGFEAKEVAGSVFYPGHPDEDKKPRLPAHQRATLAQLTKLGAWAGLVVGFGWEVYWADWAAVDERLSINPAAPLTINFFRAHGQLLPVQAGPRVMFLDGSRRPDADAFAAELAREKVRPRVPHDDVAADLLDALPKPSRDERTDEQRLKDRQDAFWEGSIRAARRERARRWRFGSEK